jgi:hypothetical protein
VRTRRTAIHALWLVSTLALVCWCQRLHAQEEQPEPAGDAAEEPEDDVARKQFVAAQKIYDDGDHAVALPLFEEALRTTGSPNARLYVARCLAKAGRNREAYEHMRLTRDEAKARLRSESKYAKTHEAAVDELAALAEKVALVKVTVRIGSRAAMESDKAVVRAHGRDFAAPLVTPLVFEPGEHRIEASAPGHPSSQATITAVAGEPLEVKIALASSQNAPQPEPEVRPVEGPGLGTIRIAGIAIAVVGVAGLVAMGVTGAMAKGKLDTLEEECGGVRCTDPAKADDVDEGKTLQLVSNVSLGIGAAALLAGTLMIIFGGPDSAATARIGPTGASVSFAF